MSDRSARNEMRTIKNILLFFAAVMGTYLLSLLSSLLIPLALALFMAILLQPIMAWMEQKKFPYLVSFLTVTTGFLGALFLMGLLVYRTGKSLYKEKDTLLSQVTAKLNNLLAWINDLTGTELTASELVDQIEPLFSVDWLISSYNSVLGAVSNFTGLTFMTILYFLILLGGILKYEQYIKYLEEDSDNNALFEGFEKVRDSVVTYIKVKVLISLATGGGYLIVCSIFNIEFSLFWGFLAFVLNFIPTFGSIVATIPPMLLGLIIFDDLSTLGIFVLILFSVQTVMGNVIEPKLMGDRLSLNTITVLLGLLFWGYVWGVTGMILSVPLLVLVKVTLNQIPDAKMIVKLMSAPPSSSSSSS